jgi:hypothetical protein
MKVIEEEGTVVTILNQRLEKGRYLGGCNILHSLSATLCLFPSFFK